MVVGGVLFAVLWVGIALVIGVDMHRLRHPIGYGWAVVLVLGPLGIFLWLLARREAIDRAEIDELKATISRLEGPDATPAGPATTAT